MRIPLLARLLSCAIAITTAPAALAQAVPVSDVEQLYAAVNNPANVGATVSLAPGTYRLSVNDPQGNARPNGGRLHLQSDMTLRGVEGDRFAVVISAFDLPASSFPQNGAIRGANAAIRLGLGHNALEWLWVRDARAGQANIDSGLQPLDPGTAYIRIAHVASSGSRRGLNLQNSGAAVSGQTIEAEIVDSDFFDNTLALSEGVRIGNFDGAIGGTVNVRMSGNRAWGQKQGRLVVNNRAMNSTVNVISNGNEFHDNAGGTLIIGALSSDNTRADGNVINFEAHGDRFLDNNGVSEFDHGGLVVLGVEDISSVGGGSNNTVNVALWGTRMLGNDVPDLGAIGARSTSGLTAPNSQNNRVVIEIRGGGSANGKWKPVELLANWCHGEPTNFQCPAGAQAWGNSASILKH
jgi:hypothetical protein